MKRVGEPVAAPPGRTQQNGGGHAAARASNPLPATTRPWVVTVLAERDASEVDNDERMGIAEAVVKSFIANSPVGGVVLFPAGWLDSGTGTPEQLTRLAESRLQPILAAVPGEAVVCLGIDGRGGKDQLGVAFGRKGVVAAGRKFHPTDAEWKAGIAAAENHLVPEGEHPRVFEVGGRRFFIAVCNDTFGIRQCDLANPGVEVVLGLVHGFWPKGDGASGDVDFARKGFAGAAKQWGCPVFASAIFFRRPVPERWPSGVAWNRGSESVKTWKYEFNPVQSSQEDRIEVGTTTIVLHRFLLPVV